MEEKQPWITCYLTDMLLSYVRETLHSEAQIDYPALFQGIEGFEPPTNPASFLADVSNWIPISVLRQLELQCEKISGQKDIAYRAAKDYFTPGRRQLPSLFEVILQVLNDVRSALIFANVWAVSQTNYLKLQSFEKHEPDGGLYVLLQFEENARPAIGAINLTKGFGEGFPRLYPFIEEVKCIEEISQLRLEDITREFPQFLMTLRGDSINPTSIFEGNHRRGEPRSFEIGNSKSVAGIHATFPRSRRYVASQGSNRSFNPRARIQWATNRIDRVVGLPDNQAGGALPWTLNL
jgi:hypothetical protein